ncbi:YegP family protein [Arthrobacter sp. NPDC056493]|uniref:YegP family protein n=1 Tax=Arthrobacter sp. NPDC056493 TaxID=3345839 RepID=UPI00366D00D8
MAGMFELFIDAEASFRFQLTAPDGTVMAVSRPFPSKAAAVEGIAAVREYAGMGHVKELPAAPAERPFGARSHTAVRPLSRRMPLQCQGMAG